MTARVVVVDRELQHRSVGTIDQDGDRLLEVNAGKLRDEHTLGTGRLLDDTLDLTEERTGQIHNRFHDRVEDGLCRAGDGQAILDGHDVGRLRQVGPLIRLRIAGQPQVHADIDAVRLGHVFDDGADLLHPHRAGHHHAGVLENVGAHDVDRRLEGVEPSFVLLQQGAEPRAHVGVERHHLVDELPDTRLESERLLGDHRLDAADDGADEHRVRDRLRGKGKPPRREHVDVREDVVDAQAVGRERPLALLELVLRVVDEPGPAHRPDLDRDADEFLAALTQARDIHVRRARPVGREPVATLEHEIACGRLVARDVGGQLDVVAHGTDSTPELVIDADHDVGLLVRLDLGELVRGVGPFLGRAGSQLVVQYLDRLGNGRRCGSSHQRLLGVTT